MRSLFYIASALAVIAAAYWAYHENYRTQRAHAEADALETRLTATQQRLRVLNAEWAYLNRPDRLRELVELNFDKLRLMALQSYQFGRIDQVDYPPVDVPLVFDKSVDVSEQEPSQ